MSSTQLSSYIAKSAVILLKILCKDIMALVSKHKVVIAVLSGFMAPLSSIKHLNATFVTSNDLRYDSVLSD